MAPPHMNREPVIRSRNNAHLRRFRALREREDQALALVEGWTVLEEALAVGVLIDEVAVSTQATDPRALQTLEAARASGAKIRLLEDALLQSLSRLETSQGVLALARRPAFDEAQLYQGTPLVVVAVGIQNPGNLGGLLRTAEAAGATGAYLTEGTADPFSWKALRGSMGSAFRLPHVRRQRLDSVLARLKGHRLLTLVTVPDGKTRYDEVDLRGPTALLLGNEGAGLPGDAVEGADRRVQVPMQGEVESLNVGVAAGVVLFEAARQRRFGRAPS